MFPSFILQLFLKVVIFQRVPVPCMCFSWHLRQPALVICIIVLFVACCLVLCVLPDYHLRATSRANTRPEDREYHHHHFRSILREEHGGCSNTCLHTQDLLQEE